MTETRPALVIVAGPNGCGKSTLTRSSWFRWAELIDPDALQSGTPTGTPLEAGREAVRRRRAALESGRSHVIETTLSGRGILRHMRAARAAGFEVVLEYVAVATPEEARSRIRNRVALGGHDVPETDARRRFPRSLANLPLAAALADEVTVFDNSDPERPHRKVAILPGGEWWVAADAPGWAAGLG